MQNPFSKIILGTVQLGMPYGLGRWKNTLMPESEAFAILDAAWEMGITTLDTSPDYGMAEARIAKYMKAHKTKPFQIISKIKHIPIEAENVQTSFKNYFDACPFIGLDACSSLSVLLHKETDIYREDVLNELDAAVDVGKIYKWGVSVYADSVARDAAKIDNCSLVQLPFGPLDQSFGRNGVIQLLSTAKKSVMVRSIFSQGLLLMPLKKIAKIDKQIANLISQLTGYLNPQDQALFDFAIFTALNEYGVSNIVLGADNESQMRSWNFEHLAANHFNMPKDLLLHLRLFDCDQSKPHKWIHDVR